MTDNNNNNSQFNAERVSLTRLSSFTGNDYPYWKEKMEMYIKFIRYRLWLIIMNGGITRYKEKWIDVDLVVMELNKKPIVL